MEKPKVAAEFDNRMQAEIAINLLNGHGVYSQLWADDLGGIGPGQSFIHGVKVLVEEEDLTRAKQILREK